MASINIGDDDFDALADAAGMALRNGDEELANRLDWLARKANAALANRRNPTLATGMGPQGGKLKASDVPSTLIAT